MRADRRRLWNVLAIPAALALFLSVNWLAGVGLTHVRLDLTEDQRHTLSDGTRRVLAGIDEPIHLAYYRSEALSEAGPRLVDYARRVRETLQRYVALSDGGLKLEIYRPAPFSPAEDRAVADGLRGVQVGPGGETVYFGLAGRNSTDDRETIALFAPERARFLEYDLTRLVHALANPERPKLGVVTALPMAGDPARGTAPWHVVELLRKGYDVRILEPGRERLPDGLDAVLLAQPNGLSDAMRAGLADFAAAGKSVAAFVDPFSETLAAGRGPADPPQPDAVAALAGLLADWGVRIVPAKVVGDRPNARRVRARVQGRESAIDYLPWLGLPGDRLAADDPATANVGSLALNAAGALQPTGRTGTDFLPLARSSPQAMAIPLQAIATAPDPARLLAEFAPRGEPFTLAARLRGDAGLNVAVVADSDLLDDAVWTRPQTRMGQEVLVPLAGNGAFVVNLLDTLTGGAELLDLRGRGLAERPFTVIEEMRRAAETKYRARERDLSQRVREAEGRIRDLRRREAETGVVLSEAQRKEIETLREEMLQARGELRQVQHRLRADVEALQTRVRLAVTWGVPGLVALVAVALALLRRRRRARRPAASG